MKKQILTILSIFTVLFATAQTKPKRDSLKFDSVEVQTIYRNSQVIQQYLHKVSIDAALRDKLDSVYSVNVAIIERKFVKAGPVKKGQPK